MGPDIRDGAGQSLREITGHRFGDDAAKWRL
jgi:hypothetical protein